MDLAHTLLRMCGRTPFMPKSHDYMGINFNIVVNVLQNEIPKLAEQLEGLLPNDLPTPDQDE